MRRAIIPILAVATMLAPALAGSGNAGNGGGAGSSSGTISCGTLLEIVAGLPFATVSAAEESDLAYMREEEKLARDVYQALDDLWGLRAFGNIQWAEQSHMDAILALLDKYEIPDPAETHPPGIFSDAGLQQLFTDLLDQGGSSLLDALVVGAVIEDRDLFDLAAALDRADNSDIRIVYQNLRKASRNHLRSFVALLAANGLTYEPQYLLADEFEAIVSAPPEQGQVDADGLPVDCGAGARPGGGRGSASWADGHRQIERARNNPFRSLEGR